MQSWFAEFENDERSQTIKAGLEKARTRGVTLGRPRALVDTDKLAALRSGGASMRRVTLSWKPEMAEQFSIVDAFRLEEIEAFVMGVDFH